MELQRNQTPHINDFNLEMNALAANVQAAHSHISGIFTETNNLYSESSVMEDSTIRDFLAVKDQIDHIPLYSERVITVQETFLNPSSVDSAFPVKQILNIDSNNGVLTLLPKTTVNLPISSVLIENDSNGTSGSSYRKSINADINQIFSTQKSSVFEYEKFLSYAGADKLYLSISLMLNVDDVCNAFFIRLFSENQLYAQLDEAQISLDGATWTSVYANDGSNKPEIFVRFEAKTIRYIRMRFVQDTSYQMSTAFGFKNRLLVGLREITPKKIEYFDSGEFVSTQLTTKYDVKEIYFDKVDKTKSDVSYLFSVNNGGVWNVLPIAKKVPLGAFSLGLSGIPFVNTLRIKVAVNRELSKTLVKSRTQYFDYNSSNAYGVQSPPIAFSCTTGGTVSVGDISPCEINLKYKTQNIILPNVPYSELVNQIVCLKINGVVYKTNDATPMFKINTDSSADNSVVHIIDAKTLIAAGSIVEVYLEPETFLKKTDNQFTLKKNLFHKDNTGIGVYTSSGAISKKNIVYLSNNTFEISGDGFVSGLDYFVSYIPEANLFADSSISYNSISYKLNKSNGLKIRIDYTYEETQNTSLMKYYSPSCFGYKVTMYA